MKCSVRLVSNPDSKKNYLGHTVLVLGHNLLYSCIDAGGHSYRYRYHVSDLNCARGE